MKIGIYHNRDWDGFACATILAKNGYTLFGYNYGDPVTDDLLKQIIDPTNNVIIADVSFPDDVMIALPPTVLWVDHHQPVYERLREKIRCIVMYSPKHAACRHLWCFFHKDPPPENLEQISRYDVWNHDSDTLAHQTGLWTLLDEDIKQLKQTNIVSDYMQAVVYKDIFYKPVLQAGQAILPYIKQQNEIAVASMWRKTWEGADWFVGNFHIHGDMFPDLGNYITFKANKRGGWTYGMRISGTDVHAGEIATRYGGGGHKGAAGFTTKELIKELLP